ncbi:hypothetical protein D9756_005184 [Leucocoprinus leucothites]|uniref:Nephrocystin 3-like N-terminal domain-containing protein n=1 Tax=Leucocoprinus leucothites TaxID=201217 RepID=A0A8H5G8P0_9AGAR|nr:hypothetical protein D9756_005184 [Leucoagaricus leucothites]
MALVTEWIIPILTWGLLRLWRTIFTPIKRALVIFCDAIAIPLGRQMWRLTHKTDLGEPLQDGFVETPPEGGASAVCEGPLSKQSVNIEPESPRRLRAISVESNPLQDMPNRRGPSSSEPSIENITPDERKNLTVFNQPHSFIIRDSTFVTLDKKASNTSAEEEEKAMNLLRSKRTQGAEANSYERFPPPRCHPETRKTTRGAITRWLDNIHRDTNMYWLLGPAGVGKSAIAQTIAEQTQAIGYLGATFFFSRPNGRDDPATVVPTLAHQFAIRFPQYKQFITKSLATDPTILEKTIDFQFQHLIVEPFRHLRAAQTVTQPILAIIDGLDECRDKDAQSAFIRMISSCTSPEEDIPLAWLVCSRPEWHLQRLYSKEDPSVKCVSDELLVDGVEGRDDVHRFICDEFAEIRLRYRDEIDERWPEEDDVVELANISSGQFAFASTAMRFIKSDEPGDPISQLQTCLEVIRKSPISEGDVNPFQALDFLYRHVFEAIPPKTLQNTMRIIALHKLLTNRKYPSDAIGLYEQNSISEQANLLQLSKASFYASLRGLHSVINIPSTEDAHAETLHVYHASLLDFLQDPGRSGRFNQQLVEAHFNVVSQMLKWQSFLNPICCCEGAITSLGVCRTQRQSMLRQDALVLAIRFPTWH